jgi:hypothetical protein
MTGTSTDTRILEGIDATVKKKKPKAHRGTSANYQDTGR